MEVSESQDGESENGRPKAAYLMSLRQKQDMNQGLLVL